MNMHGIMTPALPEADEQRPSPVERLKAWAKRNRSFLAIVVAPVLLIGGYLFLFASDQYESEAHFLVRSTDGAAMPGIGVSQVLSAATGISASQNEAMSVADYLTSHDVVDTLRRRDGLVERFTRPGIDIVSRLRGENPTPERLLSYYRKQVHVEYNTETGITELKVHSFTPQDSYQLARRLLQLGEERVNTLNQRSYTDGLRMARRQLAEAETALAGVQGSITRFRQRSRDIDPQASGEAQIGLVTNLTAQLAAARAQLQAMGSAIDRSSPQYRAVAERVRALETQVNAQSGRLVGGRGAIAEDISGYEGLRLRQQFLAKRYEAAAAALEKAREQQLRQQLYVVRVVDANMPVKSLYPQRWRILGTVVITAMLLWSIGWLIAAGVREHSA